MANVKASGDVSTFTVVALNEHWDKVQNDFGKATHADRLGEAEHFAWFTCNQCWPLCPSACASKTVSIQIQAFAWLQCRRSSALESCAAVGSGVGLY